MSATISSATDPLSTMYSESVHSSSVSTINSAYDTDGGLSSVLDDEDEDEVFFGPLSMAELTNMNKRNNSQRRSTQVMTLTPFVDEEPQEVYSPKYSNGGGQVTAAPTLQSPVYAAIRIQSVCRGYLARREHGNRIRDMQVLELRGSACVQRRRTLRERTEQRAEEPTTTAPIQQQLTASLASAKDHEGPVKRGRSFRTWFQRQPSAPRVVANANVSPHKNNNLKHMDLSRAPSVAHAMPPNKPYSSSTQQPLLSAAIQQQSTNASTPITPGHQSTVTSSKLSFIFKNSLGSLLSRSPMRPTHHYSSSDTLHPPPPITALPIVPSQQHTVSSSNIMITRQQSSSQTTAAVEEKILQSRTKRADSIRSTMVPQSVPVMMRQASAPTMRQKYVQMDRQGYCATESVRESDEETDEDLGIAAMVTKMATPEQAPAVIKEHEEDTTDNDSNNSDEANDEMHIESPVRRLSSEYQLVENEVQAEHQPQQQQQQQEAEEEELLQEDVSVVDCSSSIVNAETMSFVSCSETFASSAYETVPSREESIYENNEQQKEKAEAALRLSLRLSADATSFANFRLSTIFAREPDNMATVTEDAEPGEEDEQQQKKQQQPEEQQPQTETSQQDESQQERTGSTNTIGNTGDEDNENPIHARLRSLRSRRLNKPTAENKPTISPSSEPATASSSSRRFRATQTATRPDSASSKKKPITKMGPLQLDRLTKLNTRRNSTYMTCRIEHYNVNREGSRPPSPSLLMQLRAQERREALGIDHYSIYSSEEEDSDEEEDDVAEYGLPNGEISLEELVFDTRPLTPLLLTSEDEADGECEESEDTREPALVVVEQICAEPVSNEIKRKSVEFSAPLHPSSNNSNPGSTSISGNTRSKKQCRRPKVQWGTRSILKTPYLVGHAPKPTDPLKPILMNAVEEEVDDPSPKPTTGRRLGPHHSSLKIVRVSCIKYPEASGAEDNDDDDEEDDEETKSKSGKSTDDDEYMPKKSIRNSRKK
ncbi:hypothetical protein FB645_003821 [Coemansia sp. IMI 203386]|nr:hypothetical protein FB645_003821 [Coemansia sp. IMI 203386]